MIMLVPPIRVLLLVSVPACRWCSVACGRARQCPDVFELDGKIVVIASFSNRSQGVFTHHYQWYRIGQMSDDDLKFIPDQKSGPPGRLDYGAVGVSTIYAGKTVSRQTSPGRMFAAAAAQVFIPSQIGLTRLVL